MAQIENLPLVLTGLGLIASILYYSMVLRNANKTQLIQLETRQAQMFMQIYDKASKREFMDSFTRITKTKITSFEEFNTFTGKDENFSDLNEIGMFFEGLGVLVKEGYVTIRLVALLMTGMTKVWWEHLYLDIIEEARVRYNFRRYMSEAEYLYKELIKYIQEHPELETEGAHTREGMLKYIEP